MNIARTTLSSKILAQHKEFFAKIAVDAVLRLKGSGNLQAIQIIKKQGGTLTDSFLDTGFLLDKKPGVNQPKRVENAKILIANTPMDTDKIKVFCCHRLKAILYLKYLLSSRYLAHESGSIQLPKLQNSSWPRKKRWRRRLNWFSSTTATSSSTGKTSSLLHLWWRCWIEISYRQLIYNYPEQLFADSGVMAIEHADFDGIERLALVTGGEIVSTFGHPELVKLGRCDLIEEVCSSLYLMRKSNRQ